MKAKRKSGSMTIGIFARSTERELESRIQALDMAIGETEDIDRRNKLAMERDRLVTKRTNILELTKGN